MDDLETEGIVNVKMEDFLGLPSNDKRTRVFFRIASFDSLSPV